ncbi:MAG TPA: ATP-binding protein [Polyangium sp.]|nr:ATP-binding protein [Polyangium sp.]
MTKGQALAIFEGQPGAGLEVWSVKNQETIAMRFRPTWGYIDGIRHFCGQFCTTAGTDGEFADRVQLVVQELLENAVKYSNERLAADVEFELSLAENGPDFTIAAMNHGSAEMVEILQQEIATVTAMDPQQAYNFALRRAVRGGNKTNRLGIARMRCDGQVELSATTTHDGRVRVQARGTR